MTAGEADENLQTLVAQIVAAYVGGNSLSEVAWGIWTGG